jgi:histidinol-phosphatase
MSAAAAGNGLVENLQLALELADLADDLSMQYRRGGSLRVEQKADGSPVTNADREIERAHRGHIESLRPGHAITGEEFGDSGESDWRWYLDPIDGTSEYIAGGTTWGTLIALAYRGQPQVAVIAAPAAGRRWWAARGRGAFRDGEPVRVSQIASLGEATLTDDWHGTLARGVKDQPLARLAPHCARVSPRKGHSFLRVASGEIDLAVGVGGFVWDYMPMKLLIEEAGGRFTDLAGDPSPAHRHALVSNGLVHDEALRAAGGPPGARDASRRRGG